MFYKYAIVNLRETIHISAPNKEAAVAKVKEILPLVTGAEPFDPQYFFDLDKDWFIELND